ncbi:PTS system glucose-specific IIA component [Entomoplasma freundtii]|uniref:PTS system, glucose-specific IIA component n=1 Tax=Entomoplasma freundtii TaxID=74700 RepID=A0A2K8NSS9_9MOLU|nr:PTS glucose transporter subunit IIA [Entomoplasma freundtii]ATZ16218.1 PTS system, glucose-specific IIA component [Entomoplasma freundtii]TDY56881.1 PTS system glucose-specific IIA component [Entomoplasma freundtii]
MWIFGKNKNKNLEIFAPVDGKLISLDQVEDDVFKDKMMGDGFAFEPLNGYFVAPMEGELITVFPTKHAYGIRNKNGVEVLLHIGLDTVNLNGDGFKSYVAQDQPIKVGDKLVDVDLEKIQKSVPSIKTPLVFTNQSGREIQILKNGNVKKGDLIAVLK